MPRYVYRICAFIAAATVVATVTADQPVNDDYNTSISLSFNSTFSERGLACTQPPNAVTPWYYYEKVVGCTMKGDSRSQWSMLNAYRSGGREGDHWIHTDDENDSRCLENWTYYGKNGKHVIAQIQGRTTMISDKKRWCALPVYRTDGVEGKQWAYCDCKATPP